MSYACTYPTIYNSQTNSQNTTYMPSLVIICLFIPLQCFLMVLIFTKGYKKYRQFIVKKQKQLRKQKQIQNYQLRKQDHQKRVLNNNNQYLHQHQNIQNCQNHDTGIMAKLLNGYFSNNATILATTVVFLVLILICSIFLLMSLLAAYQAVDRNYPSAQCKMKNKIDQFRYGSDKWVGLDKLMPNITELNLILNTRVQVSINALKGLTLNSTGKANPIGFPKDRCATVKTCMMASIPWLTMNTTFSGGKNFTICQGNLTYGIQHPNPSTSNQTIELNYMNDICSKVTKQVNDLIQNGNQVDQLLTQLQSIKAIKSTIQTNLSSLNSTYAQIATRSKQYSYQFSQMKNNYQFAYFLPVLAFVFYSVIGLLMIGYLLFMLWKNCCNCKCQWNDDESQGSQADSVKQRKQIMKKQKQMRNFQQVSFKFSKMLIVFMFIINILIGILSYLYSKSSSQSNSMCQKLKSSLTEQSAFNSLELSASQRQLLKPIYQCTSNKNTYFLQNIPLTTSQPSLLKLYNASLTYNMSVPKNIYTVSSLTQVQTLKQYLFHLQTMPIKSSTFNLIQILDEVNKYSNGSDLNSKQIAECGKSVIQDQYVYNSVDCRHKVMDLVIQLSITQPRCIIIPTYDGTPGTITTHLNKAQHMFVLDANNTGGNCTSIDKMFSPGNTSCFIAKRLALLNGQNCTATATGLGFRLQNLVKFSQQATQFTDVYIQNLRNMFGVYAVLSTNLTQFFIGSNMTLTMGAFGSLSNNLLNRTKCDDIRNKVYDIYNAYCPQTNTLSMLFNDAYIWTIIVVILICMQSIIFYILDLLYRVHRVNILFGKAKQFSFNKQIHPVNDSSNNVIQVSQETFIRDNVFQPNEFDYGQINKNNQYFKNDAFNLKKQNKNRSPILINLQNQKSETNSDMIYDNKNTSPMKSKNPYGNYTPSDQVIQYPELFSQKKKIKFTNTLANKSTDQNVIVDNSETDERNRASVNLKDKQTVGRFLNPMQDQIDSIQENQHIFRQNQKSGKSTPNMTKINAIQQKEVFKQTLQGKKLKNFNFQQNEDKIKPQLYFNLQRQKIDAQNNNQQGINKIQTNNTKSINARTARYHIDTQSSQQKGKKNQKSPKKQHSAGNKNKVMMGYKNKTQKILQKVHIKSQNDDDSNNNQSIANKRRNYLQININQDELMNKDQKQMQFIQLGNKRRKHKNSKRSSRRQHEQQKNNKTAR